MDRYIVTAGVVAFNEDRVTCKLPKVANMGYGANAEKRRHNLVTPCRSVVESNHEIR